MRQVPTDVGVVLRPYKLSTLTSLSGEMVRHSDAEAIVSQALLDSVGLGLDTVLFSSAAEVAETAPAGLLNGISALTAATGSGTDAMVSDLRQLINAVAATGGNGGIVFACSPAQDVSFSLLPAFLSSAIPLGTVIVISVNGIVSATGVRPTIDASPFGTSHEDTIPQPIVDGSGVVASPVRSFFQTDVLGLKLRVPISWGRRSTGTVAWVQNVTW
jgi:hypothetical protein